MTIVILFCWLAVTFGALWLWWIWLQGIIDAFDFIREHPTIPWNWTESGLILMDSWASAAWEFFGVFPILAFLLMQATMLILAGRHQRHLPRKQRLWLRGEPLLANIIGFAFYVIILYVFYWFVWMWALSKTLPFSSLVLHTVVACIINTAWVLNGMKWPWLNAAVFALIASICVYNHICNQLDVAFLGPAGGYPLVLVSSVILLCIDRWSGIKLLYKCLKHGDRLCI